MAVKDKIVSFPIPARMERELIRRAKKEGRSKSDAIRAAVQFWLDYSDEQIRGDNPHILKPEFLGKLLTS